LSKSGIQWSGLTLSRPAAAKTGTSENFKDNLVMGYTPDRVVGVWMGNSDGSPMADGTFSAGGAGPMWQAIMNAAHEGIEAHDFSVPEGVVFQPCAGRNEAFVQGSTCTYVPPNPQPTTAPTTPPGRPTTVPGTPGATPIASPAPIGAPTQSGPQRTPTPGG
jgi:membrane carboxypeptidase/penicillin-binding protein